jgi:hypothetical protein
MKIIELKEREIGLYKKIPHYNAAEFTASAQHFREFGTYTRHPPSQSPSSKWYKFWVEEARRCIWGYDIGRDYIPGYFYWYLNYCPIEKAVDIEDAEAESIFTLPESVLNYSFSDKKEKDPDFSIIPPVEDEYGSLRGERVISFPDYWDSDYDYYHYLNEAEESGEHAIVLKTRGRGYSLKGASMLDRNFYLIPRSKSFAFANEKEYLVSDGILTKAWDMMSHIENNTPWGKRKGKVDTMMHKRASYLKMNKGITTEMGFGSEIIGVTFKNNPDKGRGKRGKLILWEEFGKFMDGLVAWNIALRSMAQGRITFGLMVGFGTGGTDIENLLALETLFTRGGGYRVHMIKNTIEPEIGYDKTGLFIGEQRNHEFAMDKNGNSREEKALAFIKEDRKRHLEETKSKEMHLRYCAEAPIKPSEALIQIGANIFPTDLLKQHRAHLISHREKLLDSAYVGSLYPDDDGKIYWKIDHDVTEIDHYPHSDLSNINGAIVIYEPPVTDKDGNVPRGLYLSGNDNYDHDRSTTESLGSTFVMNKLTQRIVAEYTGRPQVASLYYTNNYYLLKYYNALQNFENNLQGLRNHMRKINAEHMLCDTPEIIMDKIDDKRVLSRLKGTPGTTPIKKYGRELLLEWLLTETEPGSGRLRLHTIKSIAMLDELIYFNDTGNFDRVDALIYLMILNEDMIKFHVDFDRNTKPKLHPFFSENPLIKQNTKNNNPIITRSAIYRNR